MDLPLQSTEISANQAVDKFLTDMMNQCPQIMKLQNDQFEQENSNRSLFQPLCLNIDNIENKFSNDTNKRFSMMNNNKNESEMMMQSSAESTIPEMSLIIAQANQTKSCNLKNRSGSFSTNRRSNDYLNTIFDNKNDNQNTNYVNRLNEFRLRNQVMS
jgi:hypothetical protein